MTTSSGIEVKVSIDFGGILCQSEVWLNGVKIAEDDYGYLGFEVDVSDRLRWGEAKEDEAYSGSSHA